MFKLKGVEEKKTAQHAHIFFFFRRQRPDDVDDI
jgi:hypothetical protein